MGRSAMCAGPAKKQQLTNAGRMSSASHAFKGKPKRLYGQPATPIR